MLKLAAGAGKSVWLTVPPAVTLPMKGPGIKLKLTDGNDRVVALMWLPMTIARRPTSQIVAP